jgi:hypothetical protein
VCEVKLIALYFYVCERYERELKYECQRFSNNNRPGFSDCEVLTVYLYAVSEEKRFHIKAIHDFAKRYMLSWFPRLPSYQAFNSRLNRMTMVLQRLGVELLEQSVPPDCDTHSSLIDSLPVITCSGKRQGKVARELTCKGYCAAKGMYYYGLRLHTVGWRRTGKLPWVESLVVSDAAENDLNVFKESWSEIENRTFYGDKIYHNKDWFEQLSKNHNSQMCTPVKSVKAMSDGVRQWNKAADALYSKAVSAIRQPIESLFNWLIEKTDLQRASKVRSTKGLLVHVFGKITAAFIYCIFNP